MKKISLTIALLAMFVVGGNVYRVMAVPVLGPGGHYYDVISAGGIDWPSADAAANALSYLGLPGHLVTITSPVEDAFVDGLRAGLGFGEVWAGGFQSPITETTPTAGWTLVNGEGAFPGVTSASPYASWAGGEPNDNYGPASEQYLGIGLFGLGGGWNDEGNLDLIGGYAVEYEEKSVPDQGPWGSMTALVMLAIFSAHRRCVRLEHATN
jgi:hypothetical protein